MCYFPAQKNGIMKLPAFFETFEDAVRALRFNETTLISENAFIVIFLH